MDFSQGLLDTIKAHIIAFLQVAVCRCSTKEVFLKILNFELISLLLFSYLKKLTLTVIVT